VTGRLFTRGRGRLPHEPSPLIPLLGGLPLRVVDVGARGGIMPAFAPVRSAVQVLAFEPDERERAALECRCRREGWRSAVVLPLAVASEEGSATLFVTRRPDLSSLRWPSVDYHPNEDWDVVGERDVRTTSIRKAVRDHRFGGVDFLKVDTQGTELEVLEGVGEDLAAGILGVQVEARFFEQYTGQACLPDIDLVLRRWGLLPFASEHVYYGGALVDAHGGGPLTRRQLSHGDLLYFRAPAWVAEVPAAAQEATARRLSALYALYGFCDLTVQVTERYVPAVADVARATLPRTENPLAWRLEVLGRALACVLRPGRTRRFQLAESALAVRAEDGRRWRPLPPRL
jgi:FkbM family methyltransferase